MVKGILQGLDATIVAPLTPPGVAGVHVIRVSGKKSLGILAKCFRPEKARRVKTPWRQYLGWLQRSGVPYEKVVLSYMRAPRSYTGEDCLEVHCHGGIASRRAVMDLMLALGCRLALPGEFTARAFLHGKMDLAQAEAVAETVAAASETNRRQALKQLRGEFSRELVSLATEVRGALAELEARLDLLVEQGRSAGDVRRRTKSLAKIARRAEKMCREARRGVLLRRGLRCVIAGFSNAGKSTLFNALLGEERVLTSAQRGTTRDVVTELLELAGRQYLLVDTAGLERVGGKLERLAAKKSKAEIERADLLLLVVDGSRALSKVKQTVLARAAAGKTVLVVYNKADLKQPGRNDLSCLGLVAGAKRKIITSAKQGRGLAVLRRRLAEVFDRESGGEDGALLVSERQEELLRGLAEASALACDFVRQDREELAAEELHGALAALAALRGEKVSDEVLEEIFGRFCVGK